MIIVKDLHKKFKERDSWLHVLQGVDFTVEKGARVAVMGASGSGKTTLMQIMGGLDRPTAGQVLIDHSSIEQLSERETSLFRNRKLGFVFQFHHLLTDFRAAENICIPGLMAGMKKADALVRARQLMEMTGITARDDHYPAELSGGEKQRVALARALFNSPAVVLADEPTGNLDRETTEQFLRLIARLNNENNQTFVIATHDPTVARAMDYCLILEKGTIRKEVLQ
ncbi:MAG: ABC transporter ATP-binding protein [Fibrobacterota bacterium]